MKGCSLPVFDNLSKLTLRREGHWGKILVKFLERSPNLESFVIYLTEEEEMVNDLKDCWDPEDYVSVLYWREWSPPESVPKCLLSSLKTVSMKGFNVRSDFGYLDEMDLIKYLLKNCLVLEKMTIYTPGLSLCTKDEFYKEISVSEWGSKTVQVQMIEKISYRGV
jgi:hypothetical protein